MPPVPLTLEGWSMLHQMFRIRWTAWRALPATEQKSIIEEACATFAVMEQRKDGQSALFSMLGHKGDLLLLHFRKTFDELNEAELQLATLRFNEFLEPTTSYLSVVEMGLYEGSTRLYTSLQEKGIQPGTAEWQQAVDADLARQRQAMSARLWSEIPPRRYVCFYPMDKKRGEIKNWYSASITDRHLMMRDHGMIGRKYAGQVTQVISGSIGFDDWEWGVDLFTDDPLVFKKLVYEMRFDEASAIYGLFGTFYVGLRFAAQEIGTLMGGTTPKFP
ncbi:MAG: heme-dependent peroxidase [Deltaproteobacteria bacterium]|nr:heme-dependent peroxidase [Deltaproteobacteria bacterium]